MLYDSPPPCMWALCFRLLPPVRGLAATDGDGVSRFSHMVFLCVRGVFDSAVPRRARVNARRSVAFRVVLPRRPSGFLFSELNTQPTYTPVQRFECVLTIRPRMARGQGGSLFLSCMTLSFTTPCRFIPTLSERFERERYWSTPICG